MGTRWVVDGSGVGAGRTDSTCSKIYGNSIAYKYLFLSLFFKSENLDSVTMNCVLVM